jgi:hypothetical protein
MIVQVEVGGRVLRLDNQSTTRPMFTTQAIDTMPTQLQTELAPNMGNHLPCLGHGVSTSSICTGDSPKLEV